MLPFTYVESLFVLAEVWLVTPYKPIKVGGG